MLNSIVIDDEYKQYRYATDRKSEGDLSIWDRDWQQLSITHFKTVFLLFRIYYILHPVVDVQQITLMGRMRLTRSKIRSDLTQWV